MRLFGEVLMKQDSFNTAFDIMQKVMYVKNKLYGNYIVNSSLVYAIRINNNAIIYDSTSDISTEGVDNLFESLDNNLKLINNYQEINIKYLSSWKDDNGNYIYDSDNDYLNISVFDRKSIDNTKDALKSYMRLNDFEISKKSKVKVR